MVGTLRRSPSDLVSPRQAEAADQVHQEPDHIGSRYNLRNLRDNVPEATAAASFADFEDVKPSVNSAANASEADIGNVAGSTYPLHYARSSLHLARFREAPEPQSDLGASDPSDILARKQSLRLPSLRSSAVNLGGLQGDQPNTSVGQQQAGFTYGTTGVLPLPPLTSTNLHYVGRLGDVTDVSPVAYNSSGLQRTSSLEVPGLDGPNLGRFAPTTTSNVGPDRSHGANHRRAGQQDSHRVSRSPIAPYPSSASLGRSRSLTEEEAHEQASQVAAMNGDRAIRASGMPIAHYGSLGAGQGGDLHLLDPSMARYADFGQSHRPQHMQRVQQGMLPESAYSAPAGYTPLQSPYPGAYAQPSGLPGYPAYPYPSGLGSPMDPSHAFAIPGLQQAHAQYPGPIPHPYFPPQGMHASDLYGEPLPLRPSRTDNGIQRPRIHICFICDRDFNRQPDLDRHMRIHTGETPYLCNKCGRDFQRKDALLRHERTHEK